MITVREPESIYQAHGEIENGTFSGRWHLYSDVLKIYFGFQVFSRCLKKNYGTEYILYENRGSYLYVLKGEPIVLNNKNVPHPGTARVVQVKELV